VNGDDRRELLGLFTLDRTVVVLFSHAVDDLLRSGRHDVARVTSPIARSVRRGGSGSAPGPLAVASGEITTHL
jgi:hypothetical protein